MPKMKSITGEITKKSGDVPLKEKNIKKNNIRIP